MQTTMAEIPALPQQGSPKACNLHLLYKETQLLGYKGYILCPGES